MIKYLIIQAKYIFCYSTVAFLSNNLVVINIHIIINFLSLMLKWIFYFEMLYFVEYQFSVKQVHTNFRNKYIQHDFFIHI